MIKNKVAALMYRVFCFVFTLVSLLLHTGILGGRFNPGQLMYYTIQSNLLALVLFGVLSVRTLLSLRSGKVESPGFFTRFEMVCVIDLLLTLIVYWVLLAPGMFSMGIDYSLWSFGNVAVHLVVPLMCALDYFLFGEPGRLQYRDVYYVVIYPLCYVAFTTTAGLLGYVYRISNVDGRAIRFPYFFFDWDDVGVAALLYIAALVLFFLLLSHGLYWIDRRRVRALSQ